MPRFVALAFPLAGCSLIYNPSDLPTPDDAKHDARFDAPDVVLDANPEALALEFVEPAVIFEGTGTANGRKAVIAVHGTQIVKGAKISITAHDGTSTPMITVDDVNTAVADNGFIVAAPITVAVDPSLTGAMTMRLDVTVTQTGTAGDVVRTLTTADMASDTPALTLQGFDELTGSPAPLPTSSVHEYSQINTTAGITPADTVAPLVIRVRGGATIVGTTSVSGSNATPGPGGGGGGAGGAILSSGNPGAGDGHGIANGGGGGFGGPGTAGSQSGSQPGGAVGVASMPLLATPNRGSGGAGGAGGALSGGGAGGGGGGTIEISAGGTLSIATLDAKGGKGTSGASDGGGGSGGAVLLRSGTAIMVTGSINVDGGLGPNGGNGGNGGAGRIRFDTPVAAAPATTPTAYRGPMFGKDTPVITRDPQPSVTVFGEKNVGIKYFFTDFAGNVRGPFDISLGANGSNMFQLAMPLFRGNNRLCTIDDGGSFADQKPEAINCVDVVYLFQLP